MTVEINPTKEDFEAERTFCVVHVEATSSELSARVLSRQARIHKDRSGSLRMNPYGTIDHIHLGRFKHQASSSYAISGVMIDYSENEESLLNSARAYLEQTRKDFILKLHEHTKRLEALTPCVTS